jgi:hypothetical protein
MPSPESQLGDIARNLLTLEINTIIKDDMTATKMPQVRHALMDIGKSYQLELLKLGAPKYWPGGASGTTPHGCYDHFDCYRQSANERSKELELGLAMLPEEGRRQRERDLLMLTRIRDTSDQMKGILARAGDDNECTRFDVENMTMGLAPLEPRLTAEQLVTIRKAWEITTERVVAQTVIQIDGDVITRISPELAREADSILLRVHRDSIQVSMDFWRDLVGLVSGALRGLLQIVFRR